MNKYFYSRRLKIPKILLTFANRTIMKSKVKRQSRSRHCPNFHNIRPTDLTSTSLDIPNESVLSHD